MDKKIIISSDEVYAQTISESHWRYIKALLENHGINTEELRRIGYHYKTAFIHGFKHGIESARGNAYISKCEDGNE